MHTILLITSKSDRFQAHLVSTAAPAHLESKRKQLKHTPVTPINLSKSKL